MWSLLGGRHAPSLQCNNSSATTCSTLTCTTLTCCSTPRLHLPLQVACEDLPFFQRSGRNAARRRTMNMDIRIDGIRLCAGKQARSRLYLRRDLNLRTPSGPLLSTLNISPVSPRSC